MNRKENEPPNYGCHDLSETIKRNQGCVSPDSDTSSTSSTSSIFSNGDGLSSQGSPPSSPIKGERSWDGKNDHIIARPLTSRNNSVRAKGSAQSQTQKRPQIQTQRTSIHIQQLVNEEPWTEPCHANPRRTSATSIKQSSVVCQTSSRCPPQLTRQCDRTQNFVENLVGMYCIRDQAFPLIEQLDTSTQMIEVIWPLSIAHCDKDYLGGKNLIGLRTFIQEVLKRSKTSYYTLQVALYYLVLIKPCVPEVDFTQPQTEITHAQRAMQCGRRMFLAALILASKYLQDRNYSARAWSKISGLKISEINSNEMAFVTAVDWKLHIPEPQFQRWANIVFKYSTSQSGSTITGRSNTRLTWKQIVPRLTPELDEVDIERFSRLSLLPSAPKLASTQPSLQASILNDCTQIDGDKTPRPRAVALVQADYNLPPTPHSPRIPALPTPVMTPHIAGCHPPAARSWCQGQAMRDTMQNIQQETLRATSYESWPKQEVVLPTKPFARVMSDVSMMSSPESMVSDLSSNSYSSRTSRSSSICSLAPSIGARSLSSQCLSTPANHRSALAGLNGCSYKPAAIGRSEPYIVPSENCHDKTVMDATLALLTMAQNNNWIPKEQNQNQKRTRPLSIVDNDIAGEVRALLNSSGNTKSDDTGVLIDPRQASSIALSRPKLIKNYLQISSRTSVDSQAGARKKQRNVPRRASYLQSPVVICLR